MSTNTLVITNVEYERQKTKKNLKKAAVTGISCLVLYTFSDFILHKFSDKYRRFTYKSRTRTAQTILDTFHSLFIGGVGAKITYDYFAGKDFDSLFEKVVPITIGYYSFDVLISVLHEGRKDKIKLHLLEIVWLIVSLLKKSGRFYAGSALMLGIGDFFRNIHQLRDTFSIAGNMRKFLTIMEVITFVFMRVIHLRVMMLHFFRKFLFPMRKESIFHGIILCLLMYFGIAWKDMYAMLRKIY